VKKTLALPPEVVVKARLAVGAEDSDESDFV